MDKIKTPSLKTNYIYNLTYQILSIFVPVFTTPYISRKLGPGNLGIYSYIEAFSTYFILLGVLGLSTFSKNEIARIRDDKERRTTFFWGSIITRMITMSISIVVYFVIVVFMKESNRLYFIQIGILLANLIDTTWFFQGLENYRIITIRNIVIKLLVLVSIFIFVKEENDLWKYIFINICGSLLGNVSIIPLLKKYIGPFSIKNYCFGWYIKKTIMYFLPSIASVSLSTVDKLMLGYIEDTQISNGYYEQVVKIESMVIVIFNSLSQVMGPRMAYLQESNLNAELNDKMKITIEFTMFLSAPAAIGIYSIADNLIPWFMGEDFLPVIPILKIASVGILLKCIVNCLIMQYMTPCKKVKTAGRIMWFGTLVNIILNIFLIRYYYAIGAIVASVITELIIAVLCIEKCKEIINFKSLLIISNKKIIAAVLMGAIVGFISRYLSSSLVNTLILAFSGSFCYFITLIVMRDEFIWKILKNIKIHTTN